MKYDKYNTKVTINIIKSCQNFWSQSVTYPEYVMTGPILESKDMRAIFQKNGKKRLKMLTQGKKGQTFENLGENVHNLR